MNHDPQRRFLLSNQPNDGSLTRDTPPCEGLTTESAVRKFPAIFLNAEIERTDRSDLPTHQDLPIFSDPTGGTQAGGLFASHSLRHNPHNRPFRAVRGFQDWVLASVPSGPGCLERAVASEPTLLPVTCWTQLPATWSLGRAATFGRRPPVCYELRPATFGLG